MMQRWKVVYRAVVGIALVICVANSAAPPPPSPLALQFTRAAYTQPRMQIETRGLGNTSNVAHVWANASPNLTAVQPLAVYLAWRLYNDTVTSIGTMWSPSQDAVEVVSPYEFRVNLTGMPSAPALKSGNDFYVLWLYAAARFCTLSSCELGRLLLRAGPTVCSGNWTAPIP